MAINVQLLLLLGLVFMSTFCIVKSCTCLPAHPQDHFCKSNFVIRARVVPKHSTKVGHSIFTKRHKNDVVLPTLSGLDKPCDEPFKHWKIRIKKVYKGEEFIATGAEVSIYTSIFDSLCGVTTLEEGEDYLFMGMLQEGQLRFTTCNWHAKWSTITKKMRKGLRYQYKSNCNCQISTCGLFDKCSKCLHTKKADGACVWDAWEGDCESKYSTCIIHDDGRCAWHRSPELSRCRKSIEKKAK
ncbi:metalloproteinase inhibitor 3-like [Anneissia japonica]|uniref:metalloproteinase inhibitor 3-like n=1 Tax=Anneissia japonica TaxID=1529436 RepID=UPI001425A595|nr:metalloproteinase inhibitor 3-like [Anneissia japonica]